MTVYRTSRLFVVAILAFFPSMGVAQGFVWPGTVAPCNTTLQACFDGVGSLLAGGEVSIATNDVTNTGHTGTQLVLNRGIFVRAAPGFRPVLPVGVGILATPQPNETIEIEGLTLRSGRIRFISDTSGNYEFSVQRTRLLDDTSSGGIEVQHRSSGTTTVRITDNEYIRRGGPGLFLLVDSSAGTVAGTIDYNRISIPDSSSSAYGVVFSAANGGRFDVTAANNEVRASFAFGGICGVSVAPTGTPAASIIRVFSNVFVPRVPGPGSGTAVCVFGGEGAITARVANNTIIDHGLAVFMGTRPFSPPAITAPIDGYVIGNLLAFNGQGFRRDAQAAGVTNSQNLLFGNTTNFTGDTPTSAGSGTVTSDPLLYSRTYPYLRAGSPAIGRGNPLLFLFDAALPLTDADGHRRLKSPVSAGAGTGTIDIGAYEFGDAWFNVRATSANVISNFVDVSDPSLDALPDALLQATPNFSLGGVTNSIPFGVFYTAPVLRWRVFNQFQAPAAAPPMPLGAGYSLFSPAPGGGAFLLQAPASGISSELLIDDPLLNRRDAVILVTQNWNPGTSVGVYNARHVRLAFQADSRWRVRNADSNPLPNLAAFNAYGQAPTPSVFRHQADPGTLQDSRITMIDNSRLNGVACVDLLMSPLASAGNINYDVFYSEPEARWAIFANGSDIPNGAEFNLAFSPRQVAECARPLFANGFE